MEPKWDKGLGVVFVLLQVLCGGSVESTPCSPGFASDLFLLRVHREHLHKGSRIGTVVFNDCGGRTQTTFDSADERFHVNSDGTVDLKTLVTLHDGHKMFSIHAWDSRGKKHTAFVRVEHQGQVGHHHGQQEEDWAVEPVQTESPSAVLVLEFPKSGGLRRRKREWVIPPVSIAENSKGPFPLRMVQIKSSYAKETKMVYSISGEGANQPPLGLFTIDKTTGELYVSRPLDREEKDKYELQALAKSPTDPTIEEPPMEFIVVVTDQNDNHPIFTQNPFIGSVPEASKIGFEFMTVTATDADDPNTYNADVRYSIISQIPTDPSPNMFAINPITGAIRVNADGLDREANPEYTLEIQAADVQGEGRPVSGIAIITVTDSNDNAPQFLKNLYNVSVPEDKVGAVVVKMSVTDNDEPQSSAWAAKFKIVSGNSGGLFNISTGPNKQEGIITTVKPLDFENNNKYTLLVAVENDVPFAKPLPTSTATVIVNVIDVNEAPVFDPVEKFISKPEDAAIDSELTVYTATDPDTGKSQKVTYRIGSDPAGWLQIVNPDIGRITVRSLLDRESPYVKDGKYRVLILAVDDDDLPATGTGTLVIELQDVNDNAPIIEERAFTICNKNSSPLVLSVTDKDGPGFGAPFSVLLQGDGKNNWTAKMNDTKTGIILTLKTPLQRGEYSIYLRVFDNNHHSQDNIVLASVWECTGNGV